MITKVFSIYDSASKVYLPPFHQMTEASAVRVFKDAANSQSHFVGQHPGDYTLFWIATFCDATGAYLPLDKYVNLGNAVIYRDKVEKQLELVDNQDDT